MGSEDVATQLSVRSGNCKFCYSHLRAPEHHFLHRNFAKQVGTFLMLDNATISEKHLEELSEDPHFQELVINWDMIITPQYSLDVYPYW
ncbi:hypothetical protein FRX31_023966 [Thalictrum thalictroides]|uniref:Uncharacterized protein n=1 Tax=Thalictrum thalictroides TaxID=46969 RepID=A0A7J6VPI0_THATH|nr:hypothetical protein FRX31_023966 [Thalictrum thalictroides]